jgi:hypothetical protein
MILQAAQAWVGRREPLARPRGERGAPWTATAGMNGQNSTLRKSQTRIKLHETS